MCTCRDAAGSGRRKPTKAEGPTGSWRQAKYGSLKTGKEFNLARTQSARHGIARDEVGGVIRAYDKIRVGRAVRSMWNR